MTKEVKSKLIEIGAGLVLYLNALFAVKQWNASSKSGIVVVYFCIYCTFSKDIVADLL